MSELKKPVFIDRLGKPYFEGTPKNPFNAPEIPVYFMSLEAEEALKNGLEAPLKVAKAPSAARQIGGTAIGPELQSAA